MGRAAAALQRLSVSSQVLIIYSVLTVPLRLGYGIEPSPGEFVFDVFIDIMFTIDIVAAFRCSFLDSEGYG